MATRSKSVVVENLTVLADDAVPSVRMQLRLKYMETEQVEVEREMVDVTTTLITSPYTVECLVSVASLTTALNEAKDRMQSDIDLYKRAEVLKGKAILITRVSQLEDALEV